MSLPRVLCLLSALGAVAASPAWAAGPYCHGVYADDFAPMAAHVRQVEAQQAAYTYCIRTTAVYECPFYGQDGTLHRTRKTATAHGTGFAYRTQGADTLLLTNQHVAEWPAATDADHTVEDVPSGCRRVSDNLRIVDNESDDFERDDVLLQRVVADPQLDVAVLRARGSLPVLPWKVGRSASLRERNIVDVRGFPLGAFKATNAGKVVSAYDHDEEKDWDHDDFVIDALLSPGSSGSPVLALSCKTGEFELVGIYHAGYVRGAALNTVVGIDQVRDLMANFKRTARHADNVPALDNEGRAALASQARTTLEPFFAFGPLAAAVHVRQDGALIFEVYSKDFPLLAHPAVVVEDLPAPDSFGTLGRVWFGNALGLKAYARSELDAETQGQAARLLDALRHDGLESLAYRAADPKRGSSREQFQEANKRLRALKKTAASRQDLGQATLDLAERLAPQGSEAVVHLAEALGARSEGVEKH